MTHIRTASLTLGAALVISACAAPGGPADTYDLLIRGGRLVDGSGSPAVEGDVAVKDGRIARIGRLEGAQATRVIDAGGLVVAPGFIDLHTHSDLDLLADGTAQSKIRQGVTLDAAPAR